MSTLLTIDADWAVAPTPMPINSAGFSEAATTSEIVVYAYRPDLNERPDPARHQITPVTMASQGLRRAGLPPIEAVSTNTHAGVREVWEKEELARVTRLVVLDAHLDLYPALPVLAPEPDSDILFWVSLAQAFDPEYRAELRQRARANFQMPWDPLPANLLEMGWMQGWLFLWLERLPRLTRVDWVVPEHFSLEHFPYDDAQWAKTLKDGANYKLWTYAPNPKHRRIWLHVQRWARSPRKRRLEIRLRKLADLDPLEDVLAPVHICLSPQWTPPVVDQWVQQLAEALEAPQSVVRGD